jgi:hypothetical protein
MPSIAVACNTRRRAILAAMNHDVTPRRQGVPLVRWIGQHSWPAQLVLWTGLLTLAYLLLIFGLALGVVGGVAWSVLGG